MKKHLGVFVVIVLVILFFLAWRKKTVEKEVETPNFTARKRKVKAKKKRMATTREEKCRDLFEELTGHAYPTSRPSWLKNPQTNRRLELDGYCEELGSAFEYNGAQHYVFPNSYHKTEEEFAKQLYRDAIKVKTCAQKGVDLLVIPYDLEDEKLEPVIRAHLGRLNLLQ